MDVIASSQSWSKAVARTGSESVWRDTRYYDRKVVWLGTLSYLPS